MPHAHRARRAGTPALTPVSLLPSDPWDPVEPAPEPARPPQAPGPPPTPSSRAPQPPPAPGTQVELTPLAGPFEMWDQPAPAAPRVRVEGTEAGAGFNNGWGVASAPQGEDTQTVEGPLAQSPIVDAKKRKFRDIVCLILFLAFWGLVAYILVQARIVTNARRVLYLVQPGDGFRRLCGLAAAEQPDELAVDYSPVISTADELVGFCELATRADPGLAPPPGGCPAMVRDGAPNTPVSAPFLRDAGARYRDMEGHPYGLLVVKQTVCLTQEQAELLGPEALCGPPLSAAYAVDREFGPMAAALAEELPEGDFDFSALRPPYLTMEQYDDLAALLRERRNAKYAFLLGFAHRIPDPPEVVPDGGPPLDTVPRPDYSLFPPAGAQGGLQKLGIDIRFCMRKYTGFSGPLGFDSEGNLVKLSEREAEEAGAGPSKPGSQVFDYLQNFFSDVTTGAAIEIREEWGWIVGGVVLSLVLSVVYVLIMRFCVSFFVWLGILGTIALVVYGGVVVILMGVRMRQTVEFSASAFGYNDFISSDNSSVLIGVGVFLCALAGLILLVVLCMLGAISVAVAVVKVASRVIVHLFYVVLLPLLFLVFVALHLAWMLAACLLFFATGRYDEKHNTYRFSEYVYDERGFPVGLRNDGLQWAYFAVLVFAALWGAFFIWHCLSYLLSSVVSQWYFTANDFKGKGFAGRARPVRRAWVFLIKNTGTVAATSFIVSLTVYVRWVFEFLMRRMQKTAQTNALTKCLLCYVRCCLKCVEKVVKYLSRNVLVYSGICGDGFIRSCGGAVGLLVSHLRRVVAVNLAGKVYVFLGKVFSALLSAALVGLGIAYLEGSMYYLVPSVLVFLLGFLGSYYLMSIVSLTIDAVFMCYLYEDVKMSSSRAEGGQCYSPDGLARLLS